MAPMDLATALHKRYRKGLYFYFFDAYIFSILFWSKFCCQAAKLSFQAAHFNTVRNLKLNYMGVTWGDVDLIPRQNMRCGEKRVEIVTFRRGLLKKEVRSFTWLRHSSPRRKERSRV